MGFMIYMLPSGLTFDALHMCLYLYRIIRTNRSELVGLSFCGLALALGRKTSIFASR